MFFLRVLLLWALLCPGTGKFPEEIFTRPGSNLLLPIRRHLTLNHTDTRRCDEIEWKYGGPTGNDSSRIFRHKGCTLRKNESPLSNRRLSENGSLIISNVTLEDDGRYSVEIYNSTGDNIQEDYYTVHVEVPVSVPLLHVSCPRNGSAEISCRVEEGTKPSIHLSVIGGSQERYSTSANNITAFVGSPEPWNITCTVENGVSRSEKNRAGVTCPVPLSDITVTSSCLPDGSAVAECLVNGSDPQYSWSLDGRSVSSHSRVTLPPPVSGTLRCDVTNQINNLSRSINISCAVPVSDMVLDVRCLQNGSAEISCWVENGTDPSIYLTVSGELEIYNITSLRRTVHVTVPPVSPPDSWHIRCSAKNDISERSTNQTHDACSGWSGMWSDWGQYLIYGVVGVLCTALLICILTNLRKRKNQSERRTRKGYQTEMKAETIYCKVSLVHHSDNPPPH
ncbi:cell adhesion molecule CEACAM2-like [Aquarana catesbeiana]|uniref:cell adhesion molecule CEACAM2-like n=1 Tax=Aquarana catesbeiana TaxID=8400 RepID=UPI003CC9C7FE